MNAGCPAPAPLLHFIQSVLPNPETVLPVFTVSPPPSADSLEQTAGVFFPIFFLGQSS